MIAVQTAAPKTTATTTRLAGITTFIVIVVIVVVVLVVVVVFVVVVVAVAVTVVVAASAAVAVAVAAAGDAGVAAGVAVFSFTSGQRKRITMILSVSKCSLCNYATTLEVDFFWAFQEQYLQSIKINNSNAPCQFGLGDALLVGYLDGAPC
ncbi:unnamed protein product [Clonostachys chloroleuca]|uniref:Uncharacterized protein n=1 Tax=Clonostachys chloroleuca TaxID=1926264 RepID=A0AA35LQS9_9HYPO|nr:unnamed protein product [Clonostachys chloroleuca]